MSNAQFPLMQLPGELREIIYCHVIDHSHPKPILPRWMHKREEMLQRPRNPVGQPIAAGPLTPSSLINLQWCSTQLHNEVSAVLYRDCHFSFVLDPPWASFLDETITSSDHMQTLQDRTYLPRIRNVVLKVNCNDPAWALIRDFPLWGNLKEALSVVCRGFEHFSGLRRLVFDIREPKPGPLCGLTIDRWSAISPCFETLRAACPEMEMEVVVLRKSRTAAGGGAAPVYEEVRMKLQDYGKWLREGSGSSDSN